MEDTMDVSTPPVNIYEGNGQLSVAMPVPGAHREHTEVVVGPRQVRVMARCKYPQENQYYHRHEWKVGAWESAVDLPKVVDPAEARATLNFGVLVVMAPISHGGSGEARPPVE
jgi:HSP20 family molecular chaperone IbpA